MPSPLITGKNSCQIRPLPPLAVYPVIMFSTADLGLPYVLYPIRDNMKGSEPRALCQPTDRDLISPN